MYNSNALIQKFHDGHVNLSRDARQDMQKRRDANLDRIKAGLQELKKPPFAEAINQGGNAMQTMTQPPESDKESRYDIDVGIVFEREDAKTAFTTRDWVRQAIALKATSLREEPKTKKKCVRVIYADGYQCDFPVFRRTVSGNSYTYEVAIGDEWIASNPKAVNEWFEKQVKDRSPEEEDNSGRQLRRIARLVKYFAKVHSARLGTKFPGGLVATAVAVECYVPVADRDDESFYKTLKAISLRSEWNPVIANGTIVSGHKDPDRLRRLKDAATESVDALTPLASEPEQATEESARKAWKKVFRHSFFDSEEAKKCFESLARPAILKGAAVVSSAERLARARAEAAQVSQPTRPWLGKR